MMGAWNPELGVTSREPCKISASICIDQWQASGAWTEYLTPVLDGRGAATKWHGGLVEPRAPALADPIHVPGRQRRVHRAGK